MHKATALCTNQMGWHKCYTPPHQHQRRVKGGRHVGFAPPPHTPPCWGINRQRKGTVCGNHITPVVSSTLAGRVTPEYRGLNKEKRGSMWDACCPRYRCHGVKNGMACGVHTTLVVDAREYPLPQIEVLE